MINTHTHTHTPSPTEGTEPLSILLVNDQDYEMRLEYLSYGLQRIHKRQYHAEKIKKYNVYPEFWMVFFCDLPPGCMIRVRYKRKVYILSGKYAVYVPQKSLVEWEVPAGWTEWVGYTSIHPVTSLFPNEVVAFRIPKVPQLQTHDALIHFMKEYMQPAHPCHQETTSPPDVPQRVMDYIHQNFKTDMSMRDMAIELDIPVSTLIHKFKRIYGIPPHKYIHLLRVFQALDYVSTGDQITKITTELGYKNYSSLYRHCVSILGKPPSVYGRRGFAPNTSGLDFRSIQELA